jgi:predicted metal-dependent hydrolase
VTNKQDLLQTQVIRSARRKKTVSARVVDGILQVRAPAHLSDAELAPIIEQLKSRLKTRAVRNQPDNGLLERRAKELNRLYFDGQLTWTSIRWVTNQNKRAGSCTPSAGTIRVSHHVAQMPAFVRDYVLVHEMAHLIEANHSPRFWAWVNRYPKTERARGYLMAVQLESPDK